MNICLTLTEINWALTKDVFSIIGTVGALIFAGFGLSTWKRQLRGTSEYELAKKSILLTYEVQQLIQGVRNPMLYLRKEEVEAGRKIEEEQRIYDERMKALYLKWAELQTVRLESKVIWSTNAHDCFNDIQKIIGELRGAIWLHFWMKGAYAGPGAKVDNNPDRVIENGKIVYFESDEDEFSLKIKSSVEKVENFFKDKVRSR
ncbi:hypothetical protein [Bowmanella sp. JS7-9]|uniref:Uncharacterized protein n=1 Tax=Pseudobowmanella zhangzhouensis TaxID=1537679 RepID=A0ABW1XGG4_9ALTE|nr:hypothetical protein [Bowmanella sp. JS7-9]TBX21425.1 hypothetical protein TK45_12840 [Bowmanella sp. JS7-9]